MNDNQVPEGWPEGLDPRATLAVVHAPDGGDGRGSYPVDPDPGYAPHNGGIVPPHLEGPSPYDVFQHALDNWLALLGHHGGLDCGPAMEA